RTLEKQTFPEIEDVMRDYEEESTFLALVDTRQQANRIAHAFRISGASSSSDGSVVANSVSNDNSTGIVLIDDIINSGQDFRINDFRDYYSSRGFDLSKCISVETNWIVGEKSEKFNGLPLPQLGYLALFRLIEARGLNEGDAVLFAHANRVATISLAMSGVEYEPIAGREDLKTPTVKPDGTLSFDDHYKPVAIPASSQNLEVFKQLSTFAAPQIFI
ncbi:MAG: hypothetical protein AAB914_01220, partial [Patescibacteria group bacterium]